MFTCSGRSSRSSEVLGRKGDLCKEIWKRYQQRKEKEVEDPAEKVGLGRVKLETSSAEHFKPSTGFTRKKKIKRLRNRIKVVNTVHDVVVVVDVSKASDATKSPQ